MNWRAPEPLSADMLTRYCNDATPDAIACPCITTGEIDELVELEKLCFSPHEAWSRAMLRQCLSLPGATLLRWFEKPGPPFQLAGFMLYHSDEAEVLTLDVHPAWRRQGIARILMTDAIAHLRKRGHTRLTSQAAVDNAPSLKLHEHFGFRQKSRLPGYYGPGADAWLPELDISGQNHSTAPE